MNVPITEELKTFAEFYPDAGIRHAMHYRFSHVFLPQYVQANPFAFVMHDAVEPTRYIQSRWSVYMAPSVNQASVGMIFRRVTDLTAWDQEVSGHPALFIGMPRPEQAACAYFIAIVLMTSPEVFNRLKDTFLKNIQAGIKGPPLSMSDMLTLRSIKARIFASESNPGLPSAAIISELEFPLRYSQVSAAALGPEAFHKALLNVVK